MGFDLKALRQSIERKGAKPECPSCGEELWGTPETALVLSLDAEEKVRPRHGYPVLVLVCIHCGFVRMHSIPVLEGKFEAKGDH
jgi:hypothetical protein